MIKLYTLENVLFVGAAAVTIMARIDFNLCVQHYRYACMWSSLLLVFFAPVKAVMCDHFTLHSSIHVKIQYYIY